MYKFAKSRVIFIASLLMSCLMPAASVHAQTKTSVTKNLPKTAPSTVTPILSFTSPAAGAVSTDGNMTVTLHLDGNADPSSLKVMLNGTDVTSSFFTSSCSSVPCNITAQLNISAGVSAGWDVMMATLKGTTGNAGIAKARFYYENGVSSPTNATAMTRAANVASSSVSVRPADTTLGASTPLTVLPHAVLVSMDPTAGLTIGSTNYPPCSTPFNFFRLDRTSLQVLDQECLTASDLPNLIVGLQSVVSSNIVFLYSALGTPLGQLNFSSVGGTDFTQSSAPTVSSYQLVGYGQASPGDAYESYVDKSIPAYSQYDISGSLVDAGSSTPFYGFEPTDAPAFAIQAGGATADAIMTLGYPQSLPFGDTTPTNFTLPANFSQTQYGPSNTTPSYSGQSGVLKVALNPYTLAPFNSVFHPTGTAYSAVTDLTNDLANTSNGTLILLTTTGPNPFGSITPGTPTAALEALCAQFELLGISYHACAQLALGGGSFSLAGVEGTPYTVNKTYSSTYENQGDTGSLNGLLRRNHQFRYEPYQTSSLDTSTLPTPITSDELLDFALPTQVGSAPVTAWPMTDTAGHQAAYAYLSNVIVGHKLFANGTCTAPAGWCDSVRAWYTGNEVTTFAGLDLSSSAVYQYPGDTVAAANGFTSSDFSDVTNQLQGEFIYLNNVLNYQSWFNQQTNGALLNTGIALSAAANDVNTSLVQSYADTSTPPNPLSLDSDVLNFAGSYTSLLGSLGVPGAGVVGNILKGASGFINLYKGAQGTTSTNPTLVNIADLITSTNGMASVAAANYNLLIQTEVGQYFSGVDSDWFKLQTFGILTAAPSSNGWYVEDTGNATASNVSAITTANARISFYNQLIPEYFTQNWLYEVPVAALEAPPASLSQEQITTTILDDYIPVVTANIGNYSWDNLASPWNSGCQDYSVLVTKKSTAPNSGTLGITWTTALGTILLGPPSTADGLGNLNLSRNTFMDAITGGDFFNNNNFNT
jgi:hypothetical protein